MHGHDERYGAEPLLDVEKVTKSFPLFSGTLKKQVGDVYALSEVSFSLYTGEVLGIIGESGSGKTTLARTILQLSTPTSGVIRFKGQDIASISNIHKKVQMVFQNPSLSLNPRRTIGEALEEVLHVHKMQKDTAKLLESVGLSAEVKQRYPHELSLGQQQRVAIARAMSIEPELLVLDECVSALDLSVQAEILKLLQSIKEAYGITYIFISHDLSVVEAISDRVIVMKGGKIVEEGVTHTILNRPQNSYTQKLIDSELPFFPRRK